MKIQTQNKFYLLLWACLFLTLSACKTSKESASLLSEKSNEEIFNAVIDHSLQFSTLSGKLDIQIKTPKKSLSSKATLKIIKDKVIQISVQPLLGMEAFKLEISTDSIKIADRLNQQYAAESIRDLSGNSQIDFNFYNLQALFTNSLFISGKTNVTAKDIKLFSVEKSKDKALFRTEDRQGIQYLFMGNGAFQIQSLYMSEDENKISVLSDYSDFNSVSETQTFPMQMRMKLKTSGEEEMQLNLFYSKIELDKNIETDFNIPSKYKRIRLADAINLIKDLQ